VVWREVVVSFRRDANAIVEGEGERERLFVM